MKKHEKRTAFTLFELVLAIALSVALVALIGTAIDLYLNQIDASRTHVEEAQLARSILSMIADDIRAATIYQPQDTSAISQLLASTSSFDVDSIDDERQGGTGGTGGTGTTFGAAASGGSASGGGGSGGSASGGGLGGLSSGVPSMGGVTQPESEMPLGLNGTIDKLYVDSTRLPRREELFATVTGYTNAPIGLETGAVGAGATAASMSRIARPSDLKTVHYFVRPGEVVPPGSVAATSLSPEGQLTGGGLVRQEIPRSARLWAEQSGNTAILESGQALIASEVVHIEFRYFDGMQVLDVWDMVEKNCLPVAIEISLWIAPLDAENTSAAGRYDATGLANNAREYRQTVYLPMSQLSQAGAQGMAGAGGSTSQMGTGSGTGTGSSTGSSSAVGSSFGGSQSEF
jgi:uncharacterized membrane protein YgcG